MREWFENKILANNKKTLGFISITIFAILLIYQIVLLCYGTYFNSNSDDVVQYSPILLQYINYFKDGKLSFYNFSNNLGASIMADIYYVPLDIFTLLIFILSFIMDGTIAFSIVNLSKVLFGVITFAYFLQRKGFKNSIILLLSFMYFAFGGSWVLATYPTYFSLFFYLPLSLVVVDLFVKGKKWLLPLYSCGLVFYNFYNAYTLFIFMVVIYVVVMIRDKYSTLKNLLKDIVAFGLHIVLGVLMGLVIILPAILYILNYTSRIGETSFEFLFDINVYFRMIYNLFVYETGVSTFSGWNSYIHFQFSYYIGFLGLFILSLMFFMKDRISKIYKYTLLIIFFMMLFPVFSMLFSGVFTPYTRWFNFINIILIYMVGHVLNNLNLEKTERKKFNKVIFGMSMLYLIVCLFNFIFLLTSKSNYVEYRNNISKIIVLILFGTIISLYLIFYLVKKKELMICVFIVEICMSCIINFSISFKGKKLDNIKKYNDTNEILNTLDVNSLERVYLSPSLSASYNSSRLTNSLVNENSFHSFMTKYMYDYKSLYNGNKYLYTYDLNRFNPYNSRLMDYKYVVIAKKDYENKVDYLKVYKESEDYIIYENENYNPFYVYEDYYREEDVLALNENSFYLDLEKKLFDGVVLEDKKYNLKLNDYSYEESEVKKHYIVNNINLNKVEEGKYVINITDYTKFGYDGEITFDVENYNIDKVVVSEEENRECDYNVNKYVCTFNDNIDEVIVYTNDEIDYLRFVVNVKIENVDYALLLINNENNSSDYIHFYYSKAGYLVLKNGDKENICFNGICNIKNYEFDHALMSGVNNSVIDEDKKSYLEYSFDSLEKYLLENSDEFASDKNLSYNENTLNVKYKRFSNSEYDQVVVLPVTYSEEWVLDNSENYELVRANGGYLGILVKNGITNIDISLTFRPSGVKMGLIGSIVGFGIYIIYFGVLFLIKEKNNVEGKVNEEDE